MVETLQIWMIIGSIGNIIGHELIHAFEAAARMLEGSNENKLWYNERYLVRLAAPYDDSVPIYFRRNGP